MACNGKCGSKRLKVETNAVQKSDDDSGFDDIWGEDDEMLTTNADIKRTHEKQGYLEGLSNAKESSLQGGFDEAFPQGAQLGIAVGKILAIVKSSGDEELFKQAKLELNITKVLDRKFFDDNLELHNDHEILLKWTEVSKRLLNVGGSLKR